VTVGKGAVDPYIIEWRRCAYVGGPGGPRYGVTRTASGLPPLLLCCAPLPLPAAHIGSARLDGQYDPQATGAIAAASTAAAGDNSAPSPRVELDLAYAREAISNVLLRGGKDTSVPWQNPQTGSGGNIMPLATSYTEAGMPCRDLLASYVHGESQDWLQGAACRTTHGTWEVKRLKSVKSG
jgi:hypothetical protein